MAQGLGVILNSVSHRAHATVPSLTRSDKVDENTFADDLSDSELDIDHLILYVDRYIRPQLPLS